MEECEQVLICVLFFPVESSLWRCRNGCCDKCSCATYKMRCMSFFTVKTCFCPLRKKCYFFFPLFASLFLWRPLISCMPCLIRLPAISFLSGSTSFAVSFQTLWITFALKMSQPQTDHPNDLAVDPSRLVSCTLLHNMSAFLSQNNNTLFFFLHALTPYKCMKSSCTYTFLMHEVQDVKHVLFYALAWKCAV